MNFPEVAAGIYQVQLPLPFALRIVNCYLVRGDEGWTVIDTGLHTPEGEAGWLAAFAHLNIQPGDLHQIIVTHHHPDHYGMAGWLAEWNERSTPVRTAPRESAMIEQVWQKPDTQMEAFTGLMQQAGVDGWMLEGMIQISAEIREKTHPQPAQMDLIFEGDLLRFGGREFRVINGPGHSVGQALLYDEQDRLFLCADHILLKITPNVGLWPGSDDNPLGSFLASLHQLKKLEVRLALPGHKTLIHDWTGRLTELEHHHALRLQHVMDAVGSSASALAVAQTIFNFDQFTFHEMRFAVAEALAHLEYLRFQGRLHREDEKCWRYSPARG